MHMADIADARSFSHRNFHTTTKPDMTPVTNVDHEVEESLRQCVSDYRPNDTFYGEEFGANDGSKEFTGRRWIVDPIDGTKNFVRGVPVFATLIGLYDGSTPLLGVVSAPALGRRWGAARGEGAFAMNSLAALGIRTPITVSGVGDLSSASLSYSSLSWLKTKQGQGFLDLCESVWRTRAYGDFWSYMMVAEGVVDIACEPELELYDMAALVPIVQEAGGTFTSLEGQPGPFGGNAVATNTALHDAVLNML